jgi:hypothetical protein
VKERRVGMADKLEEAKKTKKKIPRKKQRERHRDRDRDKFTRDSSRVRRIDQKNDPKL